MKLDKVLTDEIFPRVRKPSRYIGTELNAVHKDPRDVDLRIALAFPDLYDLGLGNLGLLILHAILNKLSWCWAERAYAPAPDMEAILRKRGLPLFTNESKTSLATMDAVGFTLQSELTYTNILNMIDLAGIPLRSQDRDDSHPLIFSGGPAVFNPEPLAPFMDFFLMGDGEEAIVELAETLRGKTGAGREETLEAVAQLEGFYVPELYPFETTPDGHILPREDGPKVVRRIVSDLDAALFPTDYIVPFTQQVHDRLSVEVLRGCTQGCRFCQAGMVTRPVRERSLAKIDELTQETIEKTGYEEVSLVSLSTCDFSRPRMLVEQAARRANKDHVSVSLPSLRLDSFSVELADMIADVRRSGLTFAPEAASPRLRAVINKWITDEDLLHMAAKAFRRGWGHVKCYFMIGLPTECDEDVEAIVDLCVRTLELARRVNSKAQVRLGVSTFVPKPFTPFQWAAQIDLDETNRRQRMLERGFKKKEGIKFGRHTAEATFIEGLITRADQRAADVIESAWRHGARFEAWDEWLDYRAWQQAIEETGFDPQEALRERDPDERLPWDHIDVLIPKTWLQDDWKRALALEWAPDCRADTCHLCGIIDRERELCMRMLKNAQDGQEAERAWQQEPVRERREPEPVQRLRFRIGRSGEARFLSHLEAMNAWIRALRRARAPLSYSQGFHAHPKVNFSTAPPVGEESTGDYMDIVLRKRVDPAEFFEQLSEVLPEGFRVFDVITVPLKAPSLMSAAVGFDYTLRAEVNDVEALEARIRSVVAADTLPIQRETKPKKGKRRAKTAGNVFINLRPMIENLQLREHDGTRVVIDFSTRIIDGKAARPRDIITLLDLDPIATRSLKRRTWLREAGNTGQGGKVVERR